MQSNACPVLRQNILEFLKILKFLLDEQNNLWPTKTATNRWFSSIQTVKTQIMKGKIIEEQVLKPQEGISGPHILETSLFEKI